MFSIFIVRVSHISVFSPIFPYISNVSVHVSIFLYMFQLNVKVFDIPVHVSIFQYMFRYSTYFQYNSAVFNTLVITFESTHLCVFLNDNTVVIFVFNLQVTMHIMQVFSSSNFNSVTRHQYNMTACTHAHKSFTYTLLYLI